MDYSFFDASVLLFKDALDALLKILEKVESSPGADNIITARLHETMRPFSFQVHWTTVIAHKVITDITGTSVRTYEDNLASIPAMIARVKEVQADIEAAGREHVNKHQHDAVSFPMGPGRPVVQAPAWQYIQGAAIPNLFFHLVTAYDIARKEGIDLGKQDYLRPFAWKYYEPKLPKTDGKN